jgi:carbon-monoxide dehydrogenase iron sulfur subunit
MAKIIVVDEQRCLACKSCAIACALAHSDAESLADALESDTPLQPRVHVEPYGTYGIPIQCRHCEDAPCVTVCPTEAIRRPAPGGPVLIDPARCIGCKACLLVCPFGVIDVMRDGKAVVKCDLCQKLTAKGEQPACVSACPTKALKFEELDEYLRRRRREAAGRVLQVRAGDSEA